MYTYIYILFEYYNIVYITDDGHRKLWNVEVWVGVGFVVGQLKKIVKIVAAITSEILFENLKYLLLLKVCLTPDK